MILRSPQCARTRQAAVVVEFAILAPLFVFFAIGLIELSRGIMVKQALSDAVRRACRLGTMSGSTNASLTTEINSTLQDNNLSTNNVSITILVNGVQSNVSAAQANDKITVTVSIPYEDVGWITPFFVTGNVQSESLSMLRQM